jgi:hypothetical protein
MKRETILHLSQSFSILCYRHVIKYIIKRKLKVSSMLTVQTVKKQIILIILKIYKQITLHKYTTEYMVEIALHC